MATLAEIRAKLKAASQQSTSGAAGGDNGIYPHWNIAEGQTATVRFLPDADTSNPWGFWIERAMIKLPFAGVKGETNSKPTIVQVPCMEMWGETCPILTEVRPWFKDKTDKTLEEMGRKYWKKKSYLFQGFVVDSAYKEDGKIPENPIRRFIIGSQIYNIAKSILLDPEMEELPTDYVRGIDFKIVKTSKGGYADYSTSNWSRRERALNEAELEAIKTYGLFDLKEFLPKKPGEVELKVMKEMFEASVDGEVFDMDRWGQYFKPSGSNFNKGSSDAEATAAPKPVPTKAAVAEDAPDDAPVASVKDATSPSSRAQEMLAKINARKTNKATA